MYTVNSVRYSDSRLNSTRRPSSSTRLQIASTQSLHDRTLDAAPIRDLVDNGLAMLTQHLHGRSHALAPLGRDIEDVREVGIERKFLHRNFLRQAETIELADCRFHLIDGDVGAAATPDRFDIPNFSRDAIDVLELGQRAPTFVALAPLRARRKPDGKRFSKIFIRMLLRVPPGHVTNDTSARMEWDDSCRDRRGERDRRDCATPPTCKAGRRN